MVMKMVQFRADLPTVMSRVSFAGERIVVERYGRPMVALVSLKDLARLEELAPEAEAANG